MNASQTHQRSLALALSLAAGLLAAPAFATGLATCDSGPKESWQSQTKLEAMLKEKGFEVRRIKEDGGCYEVYATDKQGRKGEFYFHPKTLAPVAEKIW
jgi:hypothetical protein